MSDTNIPNSWKIVPLKEICQIRKRTKVPQLLSITNIPMEKIPTNKIYTDYEEKKASDIKSGDICREGDILLARITPSFENGKQGIVPKIPTHYAITSTEAFPIVCNEHTDRMFLYYRLKDGLTRQILASRMEGSTGRQRVPADALLAYKVPVPPLVEQRGIAEVLGTVDDALRLTDQVIERTEALKRGLMQRLLAQGIGHTEFKDTPLGRIPKTWKIEPLKKHIKIQSGNYFKYDEFVPEGVRVLKIDNVSYNKIIWDTTTFLPEDYLKNYSDLELKENDIVMALNRPITNNKLKIGIITKKDSPSLLYQRVGRLNVKNNEILNPKFLYCYMTTGYFKNALRKIFRGTDQPYINTTEIVNLKIPIPEINEQNLMVEHIETVENQLLSKTLEKDAWSNLKNGLMQVLLSGERRIELREDGLHRIGNS